jgi:trehalose synthase
MNNRAHEGNFIGHFNPELTISPDEYEPYVGQKQIEELKRLAEPLAEKGWVNINSTLVGGGVAEMLRSAIPLARGLGINAGWYIIRGNDNFFQVTKKFHNMLQGVNCPITLDEIFGAYLDTIDVNAKNTFITSDMVVIHDPQPAAMVMNGVIYGNVLWRCHIDTSSPNQTIWRFLLPYINHYAGAIFTMPEFIGSDLTIPLYQIMPCIDPRTEKNRHYTDSEALNILDPLLTEFAIDPERPILAAISRYDIHKNQHTILQAFKKLRTVKKYDPSPYLIFLGNTADDDPEGLSILKNLQEKAGDDPDVKFLVDVKNNDHVVGALMHIARGFVHVSTREGFGLVVSEALWQSTPVIGSRVGGITKQVLDNETGYLVDPNDVDAIAAKMAQLLDAPEEADHLGAQGREHVRKHFLLPELVRRYLILLRFYTGSNQELPEFRLNDLTYSETINVVKAKNMLNKTVSSQEQCSGDDCCKRHINAAP